MNDLAKVIPWETNSIKESKGAPWTELVMEDIHIKVFRDIYPVTEGHLLFVPKYNTIAVLNDAMKSAVLYGSRKVVDGEWDGFNVGINVGQAAGQTCSWPHVHLIPRRDGDMVDPRGGVRHVIPERGNYKLWPADTE
jgi:diadenosine tetraphosphate (Ap4A) HIT family hydrolase